MKKTAATVTRAELQAMLDEQRRTLLPELCEIVGRADGERDRERDRAVQAKLEACPHIRDAQAREDVAVMAAAARGEASKRPNLGVPSPSSRPTLDLTPVGDPRLRRASCVLLVPTG